MADVSNWSQLAAGNTAATPDGAPEGHARKDVNNIQREAMAGIRRFYEAPEWLDLLKEDDGYTVSKTSDTVINVVYDGGSPQDASLKFPDGARIRVSDGSTFLEGYVVSTSYANPNTSVTVVIDDTTAVQAGANLLEIHVTKDTLGAAAYSPIGTTTGEDPPQLVKIDDMSSPDVIAELNAASGLDAGTVGGASLADIYGEADKSAHSLLLDSDFSVWQRGFPLNTASEIPNDNGVYTADQWALLMGTGVTHPAAGSGVVDLEQSSVEFPAGIVPWSCKFSGNVNVGSPTAEKFGLIQMLTADRCRHLAGQVVSTGVWAKITAGSGMNSLQIAIIEWAGTEDSLSSIDPITDWSSVGVEPTLITSYSMQSSVGAGGLTTTTAWQLLSLEGITVGAGMNNLGVMVWCDDQSWVNGDELFLAAVQLNPGSRLRAYAPRPRALELSACEYHFQKTYNGPTHPGAASAVRSKLRHPSSRGVTLGASDASFDWRFNPPMFKNPTVLTYSPDSGIVGQAYDGTTDLACTATASDIGQGGCTLDVTGNPTAGGELAVHATAEAIL